jgi:hypothetical protein
MHGKYLYREDDGKEAAQTTLHVTLYNKTPFSVTTQSILISNESSGIRSASWQEKAIPIFRRCRCSARRRS